MTQSPTPHRIRLRGPWHYEPLARTSLRADGTLGEEPGELPPPGTQTLPADWRAVLGDDFRGRVRYRRRFHCPTGLGPDDRVELVLTGVDALGRVLLNDQLLGEIPPGLEAHRFPVADRLQPANELAIEVELPRQTADSPALPRPGREDQPGGLVGEVRLEIFSST